MRVAQEVEAKPEISSSHMLDNARHTTLFLKSLAHEGRLTILCRLAEGPATVSELEQVLSVRQSSVSQQLARLRSEGLVDSERDGRAIRYFLADERTRRVVKLLYDLFCE
ncbi:MAG: metalloregulator ArsR/SmtB family transcription factor [Devosia sp.]|nr:metalloregulator ArsR/SmtB family transcription factor [Devosia sp.]